MPRADSLLLDAHVMHERLAPRNHRFHYGLWYRLEDIEQPGGRLRPQDHGYRDGTPLRRWADSLLSEAGLAPARRILLLAMPRVLGYVFNPVSFWLCLDERDELRAVLCEVNNTFGESHTYICRSEDGRPIQAGDKFLGEKLFHVSPFMDRQGYYRFHFAPTADRLAIQVDYFGADDHLLLRTSLQGRWLADTRRHRLLLGLRYPLVTLRAIALIHYHAARLALKGIRYRPKPKPLAQPVSQAGEPVSAIPLTLKGSIR